ncbi:hypothetical protein KZX45_16185 [Georgenia sp. EYE_87]|uniref:CBU_0592 family membrane protein n=1 Tax=Georgenia sp. EYE_87 TaxID=2853448 RepID=UPI0020066201|nr:hypothetical protein [Georgenia sp. EYE_87]MCK6212083.1 hypothetical protein [Georgenia sp. EYE_87]
MPEIVASVIVTVGWVGVIVQLVAYALLSTGRLPAGSVSYQGLNVFGAIAVGASSASSGAWPSAVANGIWIAIGVVAIVALKRHLVTRRLRAAARTAQQLRDQHVARAARRSVVSPAQPGTTAEAGPVPAEAGPVLATLADRPLHPGSTRPAGRPERADRRRRRTREKVAA